METLLTVRRRWFTDQSTIGELYFDGALECYTLEDRVREVKMPGKTAIPPGRYQVILSYSNRFKKYMPEILHVPDFVGIRIHSGNRAEDSEGCLLVGVTKGEDFVGNSRAAFTALMAKLEPATRKGKVWIEIKSDPTQVQVAV